MASKNQNGVVPPVSFIRHVDSIVIANLSNTAFSQDDLSKALGLSKMQIYRKIKHASGKSTSLYIRRIRLSFAKRYLRETDWPVSQIAYFVGFEDHSYFTKVFSKEFGLSPSAFRLAEE